LGSFPKANFLDDLEGMLEEIFESNKKPILRIQGRGHWVKGSPNGPPIVEANVLITHLDYSNYPRQFIREAALHVGEANGENEVDVEALRERTETRVDEVRQGLMKRGCRVEKGRWV
jgi:hypothetical protein